MKQGYSQEGFADLCGVHRTFIGTIERGETNISLDTLTKVAAGLKVTLSQLLSGVEKIAKDISDDPS